MFTHVVSATTLLSLLTLCNGHLIMQSPVPYSLDTLDNSPLINAAPGTAESNFPCKLRANAFEVTTENYIKVGESNTMTWKGTASHGGGTCQLSVTLDREPSANSTFKVIASWIGGCPTTSDNNGGTTPFKWTMPPEIPNGKATLAWNWVSKLSGQPENYMNCAPVTVSGGASNDDEYNQLEDLFRVNLPSSDCGSQASHDLEIPNPGKYVTTFGSTALATPTGSGCAAMGQASATEGAQSAGSSSTAESAAGSSSATASAAPSATPGNSSSPLVSGSQVSLTFPTASAQASGAPSSVVASSSATAAVVPSSSAPATTDSGSGSGSSPESSSAAAPTASYGSSPPSNGTGNGGSSGCSTNGAIVCNGESQFGICNFGKVVWQDVASGTTCQDGQIARKRSIHLPKHARHPHAR